MLLVGGGALDRGLRMTKQRRAILEELRKLDSHPTADELHSVARRRLPRISLGTVYRNLEVLSRCGMIQRIGASGPRMRFDGNPAEHYHVQCVVCGRVDDVALLRLAGLDDALGDVCDYDVLGHRITFLGTCPACKRRRSGGRTNGG